MLKVSKVAALLATLLPTSLLAQTIEGVVVNSQGEAIVGAKVEVEGTSITTKTDNSGRFVVTDVTAGKRELHITALGFAHLIEDITLSDDVHNVTLTLKRSPIEVIDVVSSPVHMSVMESASPVTVLAGETLRRQQASTLGDSLEKTVGVHSNFHANVASTPIIRGLSGPRVMISQNGLDVSDVSRVGPDHAVATEASTATQIEVLRGPATLFYGSGAVGGVVNVVDGRVPTDSTTRGEWSLETNSADNKKLASFNATTGTESFAFYADGYWRESDDYETPVAPELGGDDHSDDLVVENSAEKSNGFTVGASYLFDSGYFGVAVEKFNREYGIPGHTHGGDDDGHNHGHTDDDNHAEEENVYADLEQTRVQLQGEFNLSGDWLRQVNFRAGFTDYEHSEIEHGEVGTVFENDTKEVKVDLLHYPISGWKGGISLHYKNSEVAAQGAEAFTPPSESETFALAIMEERHISEDVLLQLGARIERVTLEASDVLLPELEAHAHDGGHDDHGHSNNASYIRVFDAEHEFTPITVSTGLVWDFTPGYNVGISLSRSERAPSATELLSFGPHIGTGSYEIGALFALHQENGDSHIGLTEEAIDLETANNIDLTLRKIQGEVAFVFNAFYNKIDNYYYQINTGLFAESGHEDHGHAHDHDEHADELPVYIFQTDDVILSGFEAQVAWQATDEIKATAFSDYVKVRLQDGGNLPRTPPLRFGTNLSYTNEKFSAHIDITRYQKQDKISSFETETSGYTLIDASITYDIPLFNQDFAVFLKGSNLTDTEARIHSSFLKDIAPRPGRSFAVGVRGYF